MKIQLENWRITDLDFKFRIEEDAENNFELSIGDKFLEDNKKFVIGIGIEILDKEFYLKCNSSFVFSADGEFNDEFKNSAFLKINSPAIAFPYLRAFISNFTLQSGLKPLILPSINFVELRKKNQLKE